MGEADVDSSWRATAKYLTYRGLGTAMSGLPESVAIGVAVGVARVMARVGGPDLAMNERHMRRVLGSEFDNGIAPDPELVRRWSRRTYRTYARYWADGARLPSVSAADIQAQMWMSEGTDHLRAGMKAGKGVILALPHVGSWEWGGAWLALEDMPMTAVVEAITPRKLFEWFLEQRAGMGLFAIPLGEGSGVAVLNALKEGKLIGLISDRDLLDNGIEVEFFGERTTLPAGAATLALRTGAALMPAVVYSGPGNWHTGAVLPPLDTTRTGSFRSDVTRLTQELATTFEGMIRRHPEQWHLYQPNWPSDRP